MRLPIHLKTVVEDHMDDFPDGWTIYTVAKMLEIPESEAPLLLDGMSGPDRLKMVYAGKVKAQDSMEGEISK